MLASFYRSPLVNQLRGIKHRLLPTAEQERASLLGRMAVYGIPPPRTLLHIGASTGN
jgi:hypothetical protein